MKLVLAVMLLVPAPSRAAGPEPDPFAGVQAEPRPEAADAAGPAGGLFSENFGFRKELMSEFGFAGGSRSASRQSAGFEALKKLSTETKTVASLDLQVRLVRRDRFVGSPNDAEGLDRPGWSLEVHNAYADLYDLAGPPGAVNARAGRFYVPFGLNLRTDTHGTLLQLSNERDFGFERDWYAGLWGSLGPALAYDAYWMAGSGRDLKLLGQDGLAAARLSLGGRFASELGLEGGVSGLAGQRLVDGGGPPLGTRRAGLDARLRRASGRGSWTWTSELSGGEDGASVVFMQLHQLDWLHGSRRWGLSAQYRRFSQDGLPAEGSALAEATWYFRNDVGSSDLHWLKLNVEERLEGAAGGRSAVTTLQYYRYW